MGKNKKKQKDKSRDKKASKLAAPADPNDGLAAELERMRKENDELRARLERIADLARVPIPIDPLHDEEDEEYDELSRDIDDEIAAGALEDHGGDVARGEQPAPAGAMPDEH